MSIDRSNSNIKTGEMEHYLSCFQKEARGCGNVLHQIDRGLHCNDAPCKVGGSSPAWWRTLGAVGVLSREFHNLN